MTSFVEMARTLLWEVDLTFDDVFDLGRPWVIGPVGFQTVISRPLYAGEVYDGNPYNTTSREKPLIGLTGPVDNEWMLLILAHECGHIAQGLSTSIPMYIQEFRAETYAHEAVRRVSGKDPHPYFVLQGKKYVREHCWARYHSLGHSPTKRWLRSAVEWCGFNPGVELDFQ